MAAAWASRTMIAAAPHTTAKAATAHAIHRTDAHLGCGGKINLSGARMGAFVGGSARTVTVAAVHLGAVGERKRALVGEMEVTDRRVHRHTDTAAHEIAERHCAAGSTLVTSCCACNTSTEVVAKLHERVEIASAPHTTSTDIAASHARPAATHAAKTVACAAHEVACARAITRQARCSGGGDTGVIAEGSAFVIRILVMAGLIPATTSVHPHAAAIMWRTTAGMMRRLIGIARKVGL